MGDIEGDYNKSKTKIYLRVFYLNTIILFILPAILYPFIIKYSNDKSKSDNKILLQELIYIKKDINNQKKLLETIKLKDDSIYSSLFGIEPMFENIYNPYFNKSCPNIYLNLDTSKNLLVDTRYKLNQLKHNIMAYRYRFKKIEKLTKVRSEMLSSIPAIQPICNDSLIRVSSGFGYRTHPVYNIRRFHSGMDFIANKGTNVYATGDGVVYKASTLRKGYGKHIIIKHKNGYSTLYAHLSKFNVYKGKKVNRGDVIGYVGNSGSSTGNHLHYEVIKDGIKVNPINYYFKDLTSDEYFKIIKISKSFNKSMD